MARSSWLNTSHFAPPDAPAIVPIEPTSNPCRRTDSSAPKHEGISFLLFPMKQPGVRVAPIRLIDGSEHFFDPSVSDGTFQP